jgi:hypothetical protein
MGSGGEAGPDHSDADPAAHRGGRIRQPPTDPAAITSELDGIESPTRSPLSDNAIHKRRVLAQSIKEKRWNIGHSVDSE